MTKIKHSFLGMLLFSTLITSCFDSNDVEEKAKDNAFKVGIITSGERVWEVDVVTGARLYQKEVAAFNNCGETTLELHFETAANTPENALAAANRLIKREKVDALIGPNISETAIPVAAISEENNIPMLSLLSTHEAVTKGREYVFQMIMGNSQQAASIAQFLKNKARSIAVIYHKPDAYSRNFQLELIRALGEVGVDKLSAYAFSNIEEDIAEIITDLQYSPDYVILPTQTHHALKVAREMKAAKIDSKIIGTDYWQVIEASRHPVLKNALIFDHWHYTHGEDYKEFQFLNDYYSNIDEKTSISAALIVDTLQIISKYLCQSRTPSSSGLKDNVKSLSNFQGITGRIIRMENNRAVRELFVIKLDGKNTRIIETISPKTAGGKL